jgi:hypothetical protein
MRTNAEGFLRFQPIIYSRYGIHAVVASACSAREAWTWLTEIAAKPTPKATRFVLSDWTSPTANTPG